MTFDEIQELTGFADGDIFETEEEVRNYFQMEVIISHKQNISKLLNQDYLDEMVEHVLENRWHCYTDDDFEKD